MKGYRYCYAHERMLQMRSGRLELPPLEDANAVQMAIMRVQKALIDDEISEKKAGLLLYSLQMASSNLKHTTFTDSKKEVVREMPEAAVSTQHSAIRHKGNNLPRINADERGLKPTVGTQQSAFSQKRLPKMPRLPGNTTPKPSPQRPQRNTEAKVSHSRGRLCHTSVAWDEMS